MCRDVKYNRRQELRVGWKSPKISVIIVLYTRQKTKSLSSFSSKFAWNNSLQKHNLQSRWKDSNHGINFLLLLKVA